MNASKWIFNDQVKIWTESFGVKKYPAVLLICGSGAVSTFYSNFFCNKIAEAGFFVIRYDQRDYGKSSHFKQIDPKILPDLQKLKTQLPYQIKDLEEDARIILDTYRISKAHLVGHSMGGIVVQLFAATFPERLLSFTSISAGPASQKYELEPVSDDIMQKLLSNGP
ncbi:MAG: alpha/beta fold hydrolase [Chlamydiota bacterium]|jgi:pimeloyl-ACP methyl ester carboxylesterase